jgi:glutathione S-transferase
MQIPVLQNPRGFIINESGAIFALVMVVGGRAHPLNLLDTVH